MQLLDVDGAKYDKWSEGHVAAKMTASQVKEKLQSIWNNTVGVAMKIIALFWFGAHCFVFCFGGFLLNCES